MQHGLVSVISPCYNVAPYIARFLQSLIAQSYKTLEVILVNDGSTDQTHKIIQEYVPRLKQEGYKVVIINQNNAGLAAAIDRGLKLFAGEFLTWPDPDDWLSPEAIEQRVNLFRQHPGVGVVRCNAMVVREDQRGPNEFFRPPSTKIFPMGSIFNDLLHARTYFAPVCYMVRAESFLNVNPQRSIYVTPNASQNLQMLLPITQVYSTLQVDAPLVFYCHRENSRSRSAKTSDALYTRELLMLQVTQNTIPVLRNPDPALARSVHVYYARMKLLPLTFRSRMKDEFLKWLAEGDFGAARRHVAHLLFAIQCSRIGLWIDKRFANYLSRILFRLFVNAVSVTRLH